MVFGIAVNGSNRVVSVIKGLAIFIGLDEFAIFSDDFISLLFDLIQRALDGLVGPVL